MILVLLLLRMSESVVLPCIVVIMVLLLDITVVDITKSFSLKERSLFSVIIWSLLGGCKMRDKIIAVRLDDLTLEELDWLSMTSGNISRSKCLRLLILFASERFGAPHARADFAVYVDRQVKTPQA